MDIVALNFEEVLTFIIDGEIVQLIAFKTGEEGNIKFGVKASRTVKINREEIYHVIKKQKKIEEAC